MQDYSEIRKNQKLIERHRDAYNLGMNSDTTNKYPLKSEKRQAFDFGRLVRINKGARK